MANSFGQMNMISLAPRTLLARSLGILLLAHPLRAADAPSGTPGGWDSTQAKGKHVLYFTKSSGYEHSVVKRPAGGGLSFSEQILTDLGKEHGFVVTCTKDGTVFTPESLAQYDVIVFYTSGLLTEAGTDQTPPMTLAGKTALLNAIMGGKGFVGIHAASDSFHHQPDPPDRSARYVAYGDDIDPYLGMLGAEFIKHGAQQRARIIVTDPQFPGCAPLQDSFALFEEWYTFKDFRPDLHVILAQDTQGMKGVDYQRAPYPDTWARRNGRGRVFYTAMGHREDVWTNPLFQRLLLGGLGWAAGNLEADVTPNIVKVTPGYREIQPPEEPKKKP